MSYGRIPGYGGNAGVIVSCPARGFLEARIALDEQRLKEWLNLFADDGAYWVPAKPWQESPFNHVSLFYDDTHTLTIRVQRLRHPPIHSQISRSKTVRLVANFKLESHDADPSLYRVISKFVMREFERWPRSDWWAPRRGQIRP